jgi:hypothetical protein
MDRLGPVNLPWIAKRMIAYAMAEFAILKI